MPEEREKGRGEEGMRIIIHEFVPLQGDITCGKQLHTQCHAKH